MEIRNIGGINPSDNNKPVKYNKPPSNIQKPANTDSLKISEEALIQEDEAFIKDVLSRIPDIDHNKVNSIKSKMDSGEYNNKEVLDTVTEKILQALGL